MLDFMESNMQASSAAQGVGISNLRQKPIVLNDKISIVPDDLQIEFNKLDMEGVLGQGKSGRRSCNMNGCRPILVNIWYIATKIHCNKICFPGQ